MKLRVHLRYYVGQQLDITKFSTDAEAVKKANDRVALLTPIAKAYLTDTAFQRR